MPIGQFLANALQNAQTGISNQWDNGRPYREAMGAALTGHLADAGQILSDKVASISPQDLNEGIMNFGTGMAPIGMAGITAFHGSPHLFDAFDMNKIGTGEGAQAYGHGLYFAENPAVAQGYADTLGGITNKLSGDKVQGPMLTGGVKPPMSQYALSEIGKANGDVSKAIATVQDTLKSIKPSEKIPYKLWNGILNELQNIPQDAIELNKYHYKVDIPDSAIQKMLDWDKPLSEQSQDVQSAIGKLLPEFGQMQQKIDSGMKAGDAARSVGLNPMYGYGAIGGMAHEALASKYGQENVAKILQKEGIPGIRYLDGGSRGAGQGTSNYVLFDDQLPKILERNGQSLDPQVAAQQLQKAVGQ